MGGSGWIDMGAILVAAAGLTAMLIGRRRR